MRERDADKASTVWCLGRASSQVPFHTRIVRVYGNRIIFPRFFTRRRSIERSPLLKSKRMSTNTLSDATESIDKGYRTRVVRIYVELFNQVNELRQRPILVKENVTFGSTTVPLNTDHRILPDLGQAVPKFSGREFSTAFEDCISIIDELAKLNSWSFQYRLNTFEVQDQYCPRTLRITVRWQEYYRLFLWQAAFV